MLVRSTDFNNVAALLDGELAVESAELSGVLAAMPLNLKASDQAGKQGDLIFDPVGTNAHIKTALLDLNWRSGIGIPDEFSFFGTDVDFVKKGLLVEAQFSNYPFLLNNTVRSELLYKSKTPLAGEAIRAVVIVTKAGMFPASNSTLYYEQAVSQLTALAKNRVFDVPMRLIGLFAERDQPTQIRVNEYDNPRYSRTLVKHRLCDGTIVAGRTANSRCIFRLPEP